MLDSNAIEVLSVNAVKESIALSAYLDCESDEKDRKLSWDGNILIYDKREKKKENLIGRIPMQIKGKVFSGKRKKNNTFQMETADLRNYLNDGGAFLFVVFLSSNGTEKQIFYSELTPLKLRRILDEAGNQKTKAIKIKPFPNDGDAKANVVLNCIKNCQRQASFVTGKLYSIEELINLGVLEGLEIPLEGVESSSPLDAFINNENVLYAHIRGSSILHPIEEIPEERVVEEVKRASVCVLGKEYYSFFSVLSDQNTFTFKFGDSLYVSFNNDHSQGKTTFRRSNMLRQSAIDIEFFLSAMSCQKIEVDGESIPLSINSEEVSEFTLDLERQLSCLKEIISALEYLGYYGDFNLEVLTENDLKKLAYLVEKIVHKKPISGLKSDSPLVTFLSIGNVKFILAFDKYEEQEGKFVVSNFFDNQNYAVFSESSDCKENGQTSKYAILSSPDLLSVGNIKIDRILSTFQAYDNPINYERANLFMLELLKAYDISNGGRKDLLFLAKDFDAWLERCAGTAIDRRIMTINHFQIIKRERELIDSEQEELWKLIDEEQSQTLILLCAYLLLDQQIPAKRCFFSLSQEEQAQFREYPIYHFWKKVEDEIDERKAKNAQPEQGG